MSESSKNIIPLMRPRSVVVVGASTRLETLGGRVFHNLQKAGFRGQVYPVNPGADEVQGAKAYPRISDVPGEVDLAVVVVPRDAVLTAVQECAHIGVGAVAVITAGFGETGPEGAVLEEKIAETALRGGMRLLGPNCMGVMNTDTAVSLDATFSPVEAIRGGVGLVSQSGALGCVILNIAAGINLGFSSIISIGNVADVGVVDALRYWLEDEHTRVAALYIESLDDAGPFVAAARELSRRKPVLAVKAGRSEAGAKAASSHTGALATDELLLEALLRRCGVLRAPTVQDMCYRALAFESCPLPSGRAVAIITNAGGPAVMAVDACSRHGLRLPELSPAVQDGLRRFLRPEAAVSNPVDMISSASPEDYRRAAELVASDEGVDMVLVLNVTPPMGSSSTDVLRALSSLPFSAGKPLVTAFMAEESFYPGVAAVEDAPPVYRFPEPAAGSLRALVDYAEWLRKPEERFEAFEADCATVEDILHETGVGEEGGEPVLLPHAEASALMKAYGIRVPGQAIVENAEEAALVAEQMGGTVALKALSPELLHKADAGGVVLRLRGGEEVLEAARSMVESLSGGGHRLDGFVVQEMIQGGVELIVSTRRDPVFGGVLVVGLGGYFTEALKDVQAGLLPIGPGEVLEMLESLKGYEIVAGTGRGDGVHIPSVVELLGRLAQMAGEHSQLSEVELNPVICGPGAGECCAVDMVIRTGSLR